ncbi:MAG: rRNA maturation RNase YbeY [Vicinamibacterales bacterium]|jgi:probable rRNA maturation factor|nr:rRNA maturation RNase YbeY [Vicinamibacterales bacterium]
MSPTRRASPSPRRARATAASLRVIVSDGRGRPARVPGLAAWLQGVAPARARGEMAIALVSDVRMRALNRAYRGRDYATDVLSFPADPLDVVGDLPSLGDVVIATGVARRQARAARHALGTELKVLALHGLLHLLGFDHESPEDGGRMARVEARLRRKGGLPAGLIEREARR